MKIVLVTDAYHCVNGEGIATKRLAEGLRQRGHKIAIVATDTSDNGSYQVRGVCPGPVRESLRNMQFLFGIPEKAVLRKAFEHADIIQIQLPFYLGYGAARMARSMRKPFLAGFHVQPRNVIAAIGWESKVLDFLVFEICKFFLFKRVPVIQCPSRFGADLLQKGGVKCRLEVVSNGIPSDFLPRKLPRPEWFGDNLVLMSLGRHALEKRQLLLIEGVKRSRYAGKIHLLLCGKGEMSARLTAAGARLPIPPMVRYITPEEKLLYLNTADLFVHPSLVDLESLTCLEAIGCGLPCLIGNSPHSAAPQFALDDRFLFQYDNADHLAEKIDYWFENRDQLPQIRSQVISMAEPYRFEKCLDKMEQLYQDVIHGSSLKQSGLNPR